jgi:hypothetical protein
LDPTVAGSDPAEDDEFLTAIKSVTRLSSERKQGSWLSVVRFYVILKTPAEYDRDTSSVKFKDISR